MKLSRVYSIFFLLFLPILLLLSSCEGLFKQPNNIDLHETNCEVDIALEYKNLKFESPSPKLYMIFIDRSVRFDDYYENSLDLIYSSLAPVLSSEDRVILAWMDFDDFSDPIVMDPVNSIFFDETLDSVPPPSLPTPINTPILMPTLTPGPGSVGKNISIATSTWIQEQNKTPEAEYHCGIGQSNVGAEQIYLNWQHEQDMEKQEFLNDLQEELINVRDLPSAPAKYVYESFSLASEIFNEEIRNEEYEEYMLILFSDMFEWRPEDKKPDEYNISGIKDIPIVIAMPNCSYTLIQQECNDAKSRWELEFGSNAFPPKFMTNFKSKPSQLIDYIVALPKP